MNIKIKRQERKRRLQKASLRVREESMRVNLEFSEIEDSKEDNKNRNTQTDHF